MQRKQEALEQAEEDRRQRKKVREAERKARLRAEGKLLSKSEREKQRVAHEKLEQMKALGRRGGRSDKGGGAWIHCRNHLVRGTDLEVVQALKWRAWRRGMRLRSALYTPSESAARSRAKPSQVREHLWLGCRCIWGCDWMFT